MEKKTIGSFLTALRKASGMTQKQLAEKLNVSDKAVSRWERDECAPDLSLIPVLAEIYGVTSDEILRGQRANPETAPRDSDIAKSEKQRKRLLDNAQTKFRTCSLIAVVITLIGLIAACACNFELGEANLGFLINSVFCLISIVCQIVFLVFGLLSIKDDEWISSSLTDCKGSMVLWTETIISGVILIFAATLPLAGVSHGTVTFWTCLTEGIQYILPAAIICFVMCLIVNLVQFHQLKSSGNRLRLCCTGILSILLVGLLVGHTVLNGYLIENPHRYAQCEEFDNLYIFRTYMETPKSPDGNSLDSNVDYDSYSTSAYRFHDRLTGECYTLQADDVIKSVFQGKTPEQYPSATSVHPEPDYFTEEYGYTFLHLNRNAVRYEVSETDNHLPIYVFTADQYEEANHIATQTSLRYALLYLITILICTAVYLPLRKKYA